MDEVLGKYKFSRKLGKGSFGQVILVEDESGKQIAIKMILKKILDGVAQENLNGEIKCMTSINNPFIMKMYSVEEDDYYKYLICEYCNGGDLLNYQAKQPGKVFNLNDAVHILSDVIRGLEELHLNKYLHRDIKSQNILVSSDENGVKTFKLADFGFAKKAELIGGTILGTEAFMSPEVFSNHPYGFEVDMWSFGVIFFFMLNMEYPFKINPHVMLEKRTQILRQMAKNFNYEERIENSKKKIKENCVPEVIELFKKIFDPNPQSRITFSQIRETPLFKKYFPEGAGKSKILYEKKLKHFQSKIGKNQMSLVTPSLAIKGKHRKPERKYIDAEHDKLYFLVEAQKEIEQHCIMLDIGIRASLSYNLTKYFIVLFRTFLSELTLENLQQRAPQYDWQNFSETKESKNLLKRYKQEMNEAQIRFSTFFDRCSTCLEEINEVNPNFHDLFQNEVTEKQFEDFKPSYRGSTGQAYKKLVEFTRTNDASQYYYLAALVTMCHCFNKILLESEKLRDIFQDYFSEKSVTYINLENMRSWMSTTTTTKLKNVVKGFIKGYLS